MTSQQAQVARSNFYQRESHGSERPQRSFLNKRTVLSPGGGRKKTDDSIQSSMILSHSCGDSCQIMQQFLPWNAAVLVITIVMHVRTPQKQGRSLDLSSGSGCQGQPLPKRESRFRKSGTRSLRVDRRGDRDHECM